MSVRICIKGEKSRKICVIDRKNLDKCAWFTTDGQTIGSHRFVLFWSFDVIFPLLSSLFITPNQCLMHGDL